MKRRRSGWSRRRGMSSEAAGVRVRRLAAGGGEEGFLHKVSETVCGFLRLLPRGLTLGPSLTKEGQMGLWCVGQALKNGAILGLDKPHSGTTEEGAVPAESCQNASQGQISDGLHWMRFASSAPSKEERNVLVHKVDGKLYLRTCKDISPGSELLLWEEQQELHSDSVELEEKPVTEPEKPCGVGSPCRVPKDASPNCCMERDSEGAANLPEDKHLLDDSTKAQETRAPYVQRRRICRVEKHPAGCSQTCDPPQLEQNAADEEEDRGEQEAVGVFSTGETEARVQDRLRGAVRASSRLAAKPRRVHSVTRRARGVRQGLSSESACAVKKPQTKETSAENGQALEEISVRRGSSSEQHRVPEGSPDLLQFSLRERKYKCDQCAKHFFQLCHLKKHKFTHSGLKPYSCPECGKTYSSQESYRAHLLMHRGQRPFKCQQCDKSYGIKRDLKEHQVLHTGEKPFVCDTCGKAFARRPSLRIHEEAHRAREVDRRAPRVKCPKCNKELANAGSLRNHMRLHTGERPYVCPHCGKSFRQRGNLQGHVRIHTGEKPYRCTHCKQSFSQVPELRRHLISHTGEAYLCPVCGKALHDPHTLRAHERLHTGDRPFRCELCGKGYTMATKLRRHMKSHLEEKPHGCETCGARYTLMQSLRRHLRSHTKRTEAGRAAPARGQPRRATDKESGHGKEKDQQALVYVQDLGDLSGVPHSKEAISGSGTFQGSEAKRGVEGIELSEDVLEIIVSNGGAECIVVQERNDCIVLQEQESGSKRPAVRDDRSVVIFQGHDDLNSVAETVEIESAI